MQARDADLARANARTAPAPGVVLFDRFLDPEERRTLPPGVEEEDGLNRVLPAVNFNGTLRQLQDQVLRNMHSVHLDQHASAASYVICHRQCASHSTHRFDGCNCSSKGNKGQLLRTGDRPAAATLAELGMVPGHWVYVVLKQPDASAY